MFIGVSDVEISDVDSITETMVVNISDRASYPIRIQMRKVFLVSEKSKWLTPLLVDKPYAEGFKGLEIQFKCKFRC